MEAQRVVNEYVAARREELGAIEADARAERGLGATLTNCAVSELPPPPNDGTPLTVDGDVAPDGAPASERAPFDTCLMGMESLKKRAETMRFDSGGTPVTLRDLHTAGATPDVFDAPRDEADDYGCLVDHNFYDEAGGVDHFLNQINANWVAADDFACKLGTVSRPDAAAAATALPTSASAGAQSASAVPPPALGLTHPCPATTMAVWHEARRQQAQQSDAERRPPAKRKRVAENQPPQLPPPDLFATEEVMLCDALAMKFPCGTTELRKLTPLHCAYYLFEPSVGERPCLWKWRCQAFVQLFHPQHDEPPPLQPPAAGGLEPYPRRAGVVFKEFMNDVERARFNATGALPEVHMPCIACILNYVTTAYPAAVLGNVREVIQPFWNPTGAPGCYRSTACIVPKRSCTRGLTMPIRKFSTDNYIATTIDVAVTAGILPLYPAEAARLLRTGCARGTGVGNIPLLRGFVEKGSAFFRNATPEMSAQALSLGTEPARTYVCALARYAAANADAAVSGDDGSGGSGQQINGAGDAFLQYPWPQEIMCSQADPLPLRLPPPAPPPPQSANRKKRTDGRLPCCEQGEHAGRWRHLLYELSARLGIGLATMDVVLGPFCELCRALAAALGDDDAPPALRELGLLARRLRRWARVPPPEPLSAHCVLVAAYLRAEIADDLRSTVELDAVDIAHRKAQGRLAAGQTAAAKAVGGLFLYASWEALVRAAEDDPNNEELREAVNSGCDAWNAKRKRAEDDARDAAQRKFDARLRPYPAPTRSQQAILDRIEAIRNDESPELQPLRDLVNEKKKKRSSQKTLDRDLQARSEFDCAQRPLRDCLEWLGASGCPLDDASLLGSGGVFRRDAFGFADPDAMTPALRVPRRPLRLTIGATAGSFAKAAELRFERSGLPERQWLPAAANFVVPDVPTLAVRFPSHRECLVRHARELFLPAERDDFSRELLEEFWKAVGLISECRSPAAFLAAHGQRIEQLCGELCAGKQPLPPKAAELFERGKIVTTALARVALAERAMAAAAEDPKLATLSYRAHSFMLTHADLIAAVDWADPDGWTDQTLRAGSPCAASEFYPWDGRVITDDELVPVASELVDCGFFEQNSEQESSKTLEHNIKKFLPRACEKREYDSIMDQAISGCPAFSVWLLGVFRCYVMGSYGHARFRQPFVPAVTTCNDFIRRTAENLELRIAKAQTRSNAEKRTRKCEKMCKSIELFGRDQFWGALEIVRLLRTAARCTRSLPQGDVTSAAFEALAKLAKDAVNESLCSEIARRLRLEDVAESISSPTFSATFDEFFDTLSAGGESIARVAEVALHLARTVAPDAPRSQLKLLCAFGCAQAPTDADAKSVGIAAEASVALLGKGGLSSADAAVAADAAAVIADVVAHALAAEYDRIRITTSVSVAFSDPTAFFRSVEAALRRALVNLWRCGMATAAVAATRGGEEPPITRTWPLSPSSVAEVCTAAVSWAIEQWTERDEELMFPALTTNRKHRESIASCFCAGLVGAASRAASSRVDAALIAGLADRVMVAMAQRAGDVVDLWDSTIEACTEARERGDDVTAVIEAAKHVMYEVSVSTEENVEFGTRADRMAAELTAAATDRAGRDDLARRPADMEEIAFDLLRVVVMVRGSPAEWGQHPRPRSARKIARPSAEADALAPEKLMVLAGRLCAEVVGLACQIADGARTYTDSRFKCERLRYNWEKYSDVCARLKQLGSLVSENNVEQWQFACREAILSQLSRNPPLFSAFVAHCQTVYSEQQMQKLQKHQQRPQENKFWFTDFANHAVATCDYLRATIAAKRSMPTKREVKAARSLAGLDTGWTGSKVYRLHKSDCASHILKTLQWYEGLIADENLIVGPHFRLAPEHLRMLYEYVSAMVAAEGSDRRPNLPRDCDVLSKFGTREHGLDGVAGLHACFAHCGGRNESQRKASLLEVAEFQLLLNYYLCLTAANSVSVIPLRSPALAALTLAAVRERNCLDEGAEVPKEALQVAVCYRCSSVLTQVPQRTATKPTKITSCYGVVSDKNGNRVCLDKKNALRKKTGGQRLASELGVDLENGEEEMVEEEEEEEDDGEKPAKRRKLAAGEGQPKQRKPRKRSRGTTANRYPLRLQMHCQETRVPEIPGAGCVVESPVQKLTARGEKSNQVRMWMRLDPSCGMWRRGSAEDCGPDGFRCLACSCIRGTGPALPSICVVCGAESHPADAARADGGEARRAARTNSAKKITTSMLFESSGAVGATGPETWVIEGIRWASGPQFRANAAAEKKATRVVRIDGKAKRARDEVDGAEAEGEEGGEEGESEEDDEAEKFATPTDENRQGILIRSQQKYRTYEVCRRTSTTPRGDGHMVPIPIDSKYLFYFIDDDVTMMLLPMVVCKRCYIEAVHMSSKNRPLFLSEVRTRVRQRIEEIKIHVNGKSVRLKTNKVTG